MKLDSGSNISSECILIYTPSHRTPYTCILYVFIFPLLVDRYIYLCIMYSMLGPFQSFSKPKMSIPTFFPPTFTLKFFFKISTKEVAMLKIKFCLKGLCHNTWLAWKLNTIYLDEHPQRLMFKFLKTILLILLKFYIF